MLFYLSRSFGDQVLAADRESLDCLDRLLDSRKRGLLLIYATSETFNKLVSHFDSRNDAERSSLVKRISKKTKAKKQLLNDLTTFFVITKQLRKFPANKGKIVFITPEFANKSNVFYPPILLGENLSDCEFYLNKISKNYTKDLPVSLTEIAVSERFESGGGNSTHVSYERHKNKKLDLCFCIVDSDRKYPHEGLGDTAKFVVDVDQKNQSSLCKSLVIDMYSAESLLPINEIERQYSKGKSLQQINEFNIIRRIRGEPSWKHLPLKKGFRGKDLKILSDNNRYWFDQLIRFGLTLPCCNDEDCDCSLVPKISDKTLANALDGNDIPWAQYLNEEVNALIRKDYIQITKELRSWLCVGSDIRS